ncbi:MFS transporter [Desulfosarcina ovata]|uniref:MFS transporter n=1 Tax=Desulfosarcina ovata subsp. ovata TaxID=2752305 RepID=A0A5K8AGI5_9BACT|nr:MFS transporter [Desulfosarcina ovata]BBO91803.1 MFS transporter [Desulfosarcina ovata subsp. ovata]
MPTAESAADQTPERFSALLGPILFLTSLFFINFLSRIILAPLLPTIEQDLGISHGEAGSLFLLISVGYFVTLILSGYFSARLLHRRTIVLSAAALGLALYCVALSQGLWGIRVGLILLGMAAGLYLPSGIASLTTLVNPRHWGKAMAIHELAPNLSFVAAPLLAEAILGWFSWRQALALLGSLSLIEALAFARFGKGGDFPGNVPSFGALRTLLRLPAFWIMMILIMLGISATMGIFTMLPLYLVTEHSMERSLANELIGFSRVLGVGMSFLSGWANDRLGPKRTLISILLLSGTATILLGILSGPGLIVLVFVQPLVAVCFFPPAFAVLLAIGPANMRNVSISLTGPVAFVMGGGVIPMLIGVMGDRGSFAAGIITVGGMILAGALLAAFLRIQEKK